ncbi:MAG TPA: hypothetical protein VGF13_02320, partial [Verrucomicrobiae bacterium]
IRSLPLDKGMPAPWQLVPLPSAPQDLDNPQEMASYQQRVDDYMDKTTQLRAQDVAEWLSKRKKS